MAAFSIALGGSKLHAVVKTAIFSSMLPNNDPRQSVTMAPKSTPRVHKLGIWQHYIINKWGKKER